MNYEVLIVGGRPAGAALAARLGARGIATLVVDRATFPSPPGVPSSPTVHPNTMRLLDEVGIPEDAYGNERSRMRTFSIGVADVVSATLRVPRVAGRDYVHGVDRARLDDALWKNLERFPSVTRRENFAVADLVRDDGGRVIGVEGTAASGSDKSSTPERIVAGCVIGADGRFSLVARKAGARIVEEETQHLATVYYAPWEGLPPNAEGQPTGHIQATARGLDVLVFAMPDGTSLVNTHERADRVRIDRDPQGYYDATLRGVPAVVRRLANAKQVGPVVGIKRIGNGYREASGPGWALVGDALHYKDPVDGQGIYDALLEGKLLDAALERWRGGASWTSAMAIYERDVRAATHGMYLATTQRLKRELYEEPPEIVMKTMIRWMLTDSVYQEQFFRFLCRDIPAGWLTREFVAGTMLRGVARDVRTLLGRTPRA